MMRRFRLANFLWAWIKGLYWLPCPVCGQMFGGHEAALGSKYLDVRGDPIFPLDSLDEQKAYFCFCKDVCWRHDE